MSNATKRSILRCLHLIVTIPILGYIYGEPSEVKQYAGAIRRTEDLVGGSCATCKVIGPRFDVPSAFAIYGNKL